MQTWQERKAQHDKVDKMFTCPKCGRKCHKFVGGCMPMEGCIIYGQWYCSREHYHQHKLEQQGLQPCSSGSKICSLARV